MSRSPWPRHVTPRGIRIEPSRRAVLSLLRQLQRHHVLLRLQGDGTAAWQTLLLAVDTTRDRLLIDVPFPTDCAAREGATLHFSAAIGGDRRVHFTAELKQRTAAGWWLSLPEEAVSLQRRYAERLRGKQVSCGDGEPWCAEFRDGDRYYAAVVDDLSLTGIRLRMSGPFLPALRRGGRLRDLRFTLDGHRFVRQGSVCHATLDENGALQLGCALDVAPAPGDMLLERVLQRRLRAERQTDG